MTGPSPESTSTSARERSTPSISTSCAASASFWPAPWRRVAPAPAPQRWRPRAAPARRTQVSSSAPRPRDRRSAAAQWPPRIRRAANAGCCNICCWIEGKIGRDRPSPHRGGRCNRPCVRTGPVPGPRRHEHHPPRHGQITDPWWTQHSNRGARQRGSSAAPWLGFRYRYPLLLMPLHHRRPRWSQLRRGLRRTSDDSAPRAGGATAGSGAPARRSPNAGLGPIEGPTGRQTLMTEPASSSRLITRPTDTVLKVGRRLCARRRRTDYDIDLMHQNSSTYPPDPYSSTTRSTEPRSARPSICLTPRSGLQSRSSTSSPRPTRKHIEAGRSVRPPARLQDWLALPAAGQRAP